MSDLTLGQAQYIIECAKRDGNLTEKRISAYLQKLQEEICDLETRLQLLRGAEREHLPVRTTAQNASRTAARPKPVPALPRPRRRTSGQSTASQRLQGRYIAFLRQLPVKDRPKFQEIARTRGREAAIVALKKTLGK